MTKAFALTMFAAAALAPLPVGAQAPATTPATSSTAAYAPAKADASKKVVGCVVAGADGSTFTFTESAMPVSPATSGDATVTPAPSTRASWTLMSHSDVDLSKYAGKRVELTGSTDMKMGVSADKTQSTTRSSNATTGPRFHVKSVKVLADTCS